MTADPLDHAAEIAATYGTLPGVVAVALGGSLGAGRGDAASDLDLYVYATGEPPLAGRLALARARADRFEVDNRFWETGDEWLERMDGLHVDVMFRTPDFAEDVLARLLERHEASLGYSTALLSNLIHSRALFDPTGWYARLQAQANQPYPDALARAIIARNWPLLRGRLGAYPNQLALAVRRDDPVVVNHRLAALLSSAFDVLFALNRRLHPGEKRLLALATDLPLRPPDFTAQVQGLLSAAPGALLARVTALVDGLETLLAGQDALPEDG